MDKVYRDFLRKALDSLRENGIYKSERIITIPQSTLIQTTDANKVINLCANNYLGLTNHTGVIKAARVALDTYDMDYLLSDLCEERKLSTKLWNTKLVNSYKPKILFSILPILMTILNYLKRC